MGFSMVRAIIISSLLFALAGCATLTAFLAATEHPVVKATIQYGVIRYLSNDQEKANEAERIVTEIRSYVDQSAQVTVYELEDLALEKIPWGKLNPADQFILMGMVANIADHLRQEVGDGTISGEQKIRVKDFLTWILQAIRFSQI